MAQSIPSPLNPSRGICRTFFKNFSFPTVGHSPKVSLVGHCQKQLGLSDFMSIVQFHSSMCKYLHNCFHLRTRDDSTERERVAVFAVIKRFELLQILKYTFICERLLLSCSAGWSFALCQKPHVGHLQAYLQLSWPHRGAFSTILKSKGKCPAWDDRA